MTLFSLALSAMVTIGATVTAGADIRVAVVNVPKISEAYLRTADLEAQFEQLRVKFNEESNAMRDRLKRGVTALREELKPGTAEFLQRRKELAQLEWELQYFIESQGQELERGLARSLRQIYQDIQNTVRVVAEEQGIDVVLACDQLPKGMPDSTSVARQQIVLQKVVYWSPRVDLTDIVIERLNATYQSTRPKDVTGSAQPLEQPERTARQASPAGAHVAPPVG